MKKIVESSNPHYTDEDIMIKEEKLEAKTDFQVKHAEHEPLTLDSGKYTVGHVVEASPAEKEIRRIAD